MSTFASRIIAFNKNISFTGSLPPGIRIMNPFKENEFALPVSTFFYKKYYSDTNKRHLILGINPGRFGAGITGVPFTDPQAAGGTNAIFRSPAQMPMSRPAYLCTM